MSRAGVWVEELPELRARLAEILPPEVAGKAGAFAEMWVAEARAGETEIALPPTKALKRIQGLWKRIEALRDELRNLPDEIEGPLAEALALAHIESRAQLLGDADKALDRLVKGLWLTERRIGDSDKREGRPPAFRGFLVRTIAAQMEAAGLVPNARPTGPLVVAVGAVLEAAGQRVTRVENVVRSALEDRSKPLP
jgi:hypothetical protein